MSNPRKSARDKPVAIKAQSERAPDAKLSKSKKPNGAGRKVPKPKTLAAEIGATVMREQTASGEPKQAEPPRPVRVTAAKPIPPVAKPAPVKSPPRKPAQAAPAPAAAKPAAEPPAKPMTPAKPAQVVSKPAMSKPVVSKAPEAPQHPVENAVETLERSFKAAGEGTVAVNCKLLDFARANVNSSLDHVRDLAAAKSPVRILRLQIEYWHDCLETFANQAQELRAMSAEL
ncbi:MAG TPA: phasin family protein, partial [Methyloceanibacter sp.]|nr:phasin family protein [Methyloceanibacter sp.]